MPPDELVKIGDLSPGTIALLKNVADTAAERAVHNFAVAMGLDPTNPIQAQEDFSIMRYWGQKIRDQEFRADEAWTRTTRRRCESIVGKMMLTVVGITVTAALGAFLTGLIYILRSPR